MVEVSVLIESSYVLEIETDEVSRLTHGTIALWAPSSATIPLGRVEAQPACCAQMPPVSPHAVAASPGMIEEFAKSHLDYHLRWVREALVLRLEGLTEYDVRRPLTLTGTNLLGLVKRNAVWDFRYFGEVFSRPPIESVPGGTTS